ncbi:MAG: protein-glutamate O-methyltransferase CheR [Syntrophobacterales bacterium]|nr:MAG: protein-glutamate O-methyltransferase CheR [Syntrophobacterales bacterium]
MTSGELSDIDFEKISRLVYDLCGINLHEGKKALVKSRLNKRLREGRFRSLSDYLKYVTTKKGADELITMIDSLSTNLTSFFREEKHFLKLHEILPGMVRPRSRRGYRIWCAGCSTGEEPYSIAITLKEVLNGKSTDCKILATDISTNVLRTAMAGIYSEERVKTIPQPLLRKYFQIGHGSWEGRYRVKKDLKDMVEFKRFNLMHTLSSDKVFDVIFCRNVMIYFDKETQGKVVNRFYDCLGENGWLFIGHSESLTGLTHSFKYIEPSIYRK